MTKEERDENRKFWKLRLKLKVISRGKQVSGERTIVGKTYREGTKGIINKQKTTFVQTNENLLFIVPFVNGGKNFNGDKHVQKTFEPKICTLNELKYIYTNADSFMNKYDEFKLRYLSDIKQAPEIIMVTEVLPKNSDITLIRLNFHLVIMICSEIIPRQKADVE
ncbi:unnamed protein product [Mytilus edulis]|uniref:Uncharacterized protein n=1 Tax=Mytilus edulis TaxID=6550 RepID=A0A8S3VJ59_MYTED|nr:unnamed protein product [Mytilus edulis]